MFHLFSVGAATPRTVVAMIHSATAAMMHSYVRRTNRIHMVEVVQVRPSLHYLFLEWIRDGLGGGRYVGWEYALTFSIAMDDEGVSSLKPASTVRAKLWFGVELSNSMCHLGCLLQHIGNLGSSIISRQTFETFNYLACG
jgi:hypothetical protein